MFLKFKNFHVFLHSMKLFREIFMNGRLMKIFVSRFSFVFLNSQTDHWKFQWKLVWSDLDGMIQLIHNFNRRKRWKINYKRVQWIFWIGDIRKSRQRNDCHLLFSSISIQISLIESIRIQRKSSIYFNNSSHKNDIKT